MSIKSTSRSKLLNEFQSKKLIQEFGIPVTRGVIAKSSRDAVAYAEALGYPLVMKIVSSDITHKSDIGGVRIGIKSPKEVSETFVDLTEKSQLLAPGSRIDGVYVQEQVTDGVEVIIGAKSDATFGSIVLFGLGGTLVELLNEFSIRIVPFSEYDVGEMIREVKTSKILYGFRSKVCDIDALVGLILNVENLITQNPDIQELDLNPVMVREKGKGVIVADARIVLG